MKTQFIITIICTAILMAFSSNPAKAQSAIVDITVNNGLVRSDYGSDPRPGIDQSGSVNEGCVAGKIWNLEAFGFNPTTTSLTYVGGFNPLATTHTNEPTEGFTLGDIFLASTTITQAALPGVDNQNGYFNYTNPGYAYAIHITPPASGATAQYTVYKLSANSTVNTVYFYNPNDNPGGNRSSNPYSLIPNFVPGADTIIGTGTTTVHAMSDAQVQANTGINIGTNGGTNYVMTLGLNFTSSLSSLLSDFNASLTIGCGNDDLKGAYVASVPVPEIPMSVNMAMEAMLLLCCFRLFRRKLTA